MKVRNLIGGLLVAVIVAVVLTQTAEAFYFNCEVAGWDICWPF